MFLVVSFFDEVCDNVFEVLILLNTLFVQNLQIQLHHIRVICKLFGLTVCYEFLLELVVVFVVSVAEGLDQLMYKIFSFLNHFQLHIVQLRYNIMINLLVIRSHYLIEIDHFVDFLAKGSVADVFVYVLESE